MTATLNRIVRPDVEYSVETGHRKIGLGVGAIALMIGMVVTGFVPSPLGTVTSYVPTLPEILITLGIYVFGALLITAFYKITLSLRGQLKT